MIDLIQSMKRWHWVAIALVIGLIFGSVRRHELRDLRDRAAYCLNDKEHFEEAVLHQVQGRPLFKDISVYSCRLDDGAGGTRPASVVSGTYCNGFPDPHDGKYHWREAFFVASIPFRPATDLAGINGLSADASKQFGPGSNATVVDFLRVVSASRGTSFTNAWWDTYVLGTWLVGALLLIGGVWPALLNFYSYRTLRRPADEPGIDLSAVKNPAPAAEAALNASDADASLTALEAELAANLETDEPAPAAEEPVTTAIADLSKGSQEPGSAVTSEAQTEFGAKEDDFYPTERHGSAARQ